MENMLGTGPRGLQFDTYYLSNIVMRAAALHLIMSAARRMKEGVHDKRANQNMN